MSVELKRRALDLNEALAEEQDAACHDLEAQIHAMLLGQETAAPPCK